MPNENKDISETLNELMDAQNVTIEKLVLATNIPMRFLTSIKDGELGKLPAEPYVRGYLIKIAGALKADPNLLINAYKESVKELKAKTADKLPDNQFARTAVKKSWIIAPLIIIGISMLIFIRFNNIFGVPELHINLPDSVSFEPLKIEGSVKPGDKITLNSEIVYTDEAGKFEETIPLAPGLNILKFKIKRFLGRETTVTKQVVYSPLTEDTNQNINKK